MREQRFVIVKAVATGQVESYVCPLALVPEMLMSWALMASVGDWNEYRRADNTLVIFRER